MNFLLYFFALALFLCDTSFLFKSYSKEIYLFPIPNGKILLKIGMNTSAEGSALFAVTLDKFSLAERS